MLIELMTCPRVDKDLTHESVRIPLLFGLLGKVKYSESAGKVILIGVVLDEGDCGDPFWRLWTSATDWIAKVVCEAAKSVDFEFVKYLEWDLVKKPIDNHSSLDASLRV